MKLFSRMALVLIFALLQSGCGLLLGNVKPVDEKSESYGVLDLSKSKPGEWTRLDPTKVAEPERPEANSAGNSSSEVSDAVYQNKKTAATISLNSACRPKIDKSESNSAGADYGSNQTADLRKVTNLLLLGLSEVTLRSESELTLQGRLALQTTLRGKLNREDVMLRTVVTRKGTCTYDLVYLAPPEQFQTNLGDFSQFVASLRLK